MQILNIAGYQFTALHDLPALQESLLTQCRKLDLKGTILLSHEGINISLAGQEAAIRRFQLDLKSHFNITRFHETWSDTQPFRFLKVKIKNEIITFNQTDANPINQQAPDLAPETLKQWLDEKRDFILLDTRNDYEVRFGTFTGAVNLKIDDFSELADKLGQLAKDKPIVSFCTGGIRCEKAVLHMLNQGFNEVYQLTGGILAYFQKVGGSHYEGECFVFDERISLNSDLKTSGTKQCATCQSPVAATLSACPACHEHQV